MNIHVVTPDVTPDDERLAEWAALARIVHRLHLRFPMKTPADVYRIAHALLQRGAPAERLVIHDHVDVAWLLSVPAVQCGRRSPPAAAVRDKFPTLTIGVSVHSVQEALQAERAGADYVLFGHVFPTASKAGRPAQGLARLREVTRSVRLPVMAIGGVTPRRLAGLAAAGAAGAAVQRGVFGARDPLQAARAYVAQARRCQAPRSFVIAKPHEEGSSC